jgi:outer membrane immunogenic protein
MKTTLATVVLLLCASAAPAQDWSGGYLGLSLGQGSGEVDVPSTSGTDTLDSSTVYGLFAGYNLQRNSMAYGAELAYHSGDIDSAGIPGQGIDRLVDLKGRIGYVTGPGLVYGVLGYSTNRAFVPGATSDGDGFSYGIGYDYQINDAFTIGGEYLNRKMQNDETPDILELEPDIATFSLRAAIKF